jgi:arginase
MIADTGRLGSLDVMELNPALDLRNKTAELAVDLIESLFGKSTLMRQHAPPQPKLRSQAADLRSVKRIAERRA